MKELEILLENYWIDKNKDKELYYKIKDSVPSYKSFISDKLGYSLIVNPYLIKLEKLPGRAEGWMGIKDFDNTMEYAFLCLLLMFLEDKGREEQFVLSGITEYIQGNFIGEEKVDWTLYRHRRYLIKVLRFAVNIGMIKVDDGDEQNFASSLETEVLYESTGLSRYFVRNFTSSILNYNSYKDIENEEWGDIEIDRGIARRHRVYRKIVMCPIVYNEGTEDVDYDYIKKQRGLIASDLENFLEYDFHVHRNGALVVLNNEKNLKDCFPGGRAISDVVLFFNRMILEEIKEKTIQLKANDTAIISRSHFDDMVEKLKRYYSYGWSKEYREMSIAALSGEILSFMTDFNMLRVLRMGKEIELLPLIGKVAGSYPREFEEAAVEKEDN
ncbi:TIGR02678 family protein [Clostridium manihotivorum]|uniref:TIGR02678 family protein n=1 Tax=Clostridium manihotivorum TaxID=2320868 RepID=A0A3R5QVE1_9CLOT|nr:TIGR02678 family protein [Clostridium manihotivorum]QAA33569.1 TIGR02678 family protein [Clostridium manihotivorum]